jgi:hypothetical protein
MKKEINIQKRVFEKQQYEQVIDTSFTQLGIQNQPPVEPETQTVAQFFETYTNLFYQIPKEGITNSHRFLVEQSGEYIGGEGISEEITALQEEITNLREENLELQQQLLNLARTNG